MNQATEMPQNWDDHIGWDNYYESKIFDFPKPHNWEQIKFWN